jgi:GNAT superfamily N-acetyltransferase
MAVKVLIEPIQLPAPGLEQMQAEARAEGYRFLETLFEEWMSGENRFDGAGEVLCGSFDRGILVAVGGLNRDPFLADPSVGRIRRVYVRRAWRNKGVGGALLDTLLSAAHGNFRTVRLRAENPNAARLYERRGFSRIVSPNATHILHFESL